MGMPCLVLCVGCTLETLHQGLDEPNANEMVALLRRQGISAHKVQDHDSGAFAVAVPRESFADSVRLVTAASLPRPTFKGTEALGKGETFLPNPDEARAIEGHARGQDISRALLKLKDVVDAQTLLAIPANNDLSIAQNAGPSASVFLQFRASPEGAPPVRTEEVQRLVASAVPDLYMNPDRVAVYMTPAPAPIPDVPAESPLETVLGMHVARGDALELRILIGALTGLLALLASSLAWMAARPRRRQST
jgi:type III secretion system YscJ/HrcJ family lipoprotein